MVRTDAIPSNKTVNKLFQEYQVWLCTEKKKPVKVGKSHCERRGELKSWGQILFDSKSSEGVLLVCCIAFNLDFAGAVRVIVWDTLVYVLGSLAQAPLYL